MSSITYGTGTYNRVYALPVARTRLRLTRRGRAVIAVLVSLPLVIALVMLALNGGGATATSGLEQSSTVTVQGGQSLWSLAVWAACYRAWGWEMRQGSLSLTP